MWYCSMNKEKKRKKMAYKGGDTRELAWVDPVRTRKIAAGQCGAKKRKKEKEEKKKGKRKKEKRKIKRGKSNFEYFCSIYFPF